MERPGEKLYVPYCDTRQEQDFVSWDSILCLATGEWRGHTWKISLKAVYFVLCGGIQVYKHCYSKELQLM